MSVIYLFGVLFSFWGFNPLVLVVLVLVDIGLYRGWKDHQDRLKGEGKYKDRV